jgi:iron complex transport system ATP-binding protein
MVDEGSNVPEVLLDVDGVTFGYERQPLLFDVHVQVRKGEMVGLLGPNGSGKTTLLRLVSGVLQPQQGRILLDGRELQDWGRRGVAQRVAVVPQELHVPFAYTVEQLVNLGRTPFVNLLGSNSRQEAIVVQDAMQASGVTPLANRILMN